MERSEFVCLNLLSVGRIAILSAYLLFLPLHLRDAGIDAFGIGSLFAIFSIAGLISAFPFGILNDTLGSKRLIQLSLGILLAAVLATYFSRDFAGFAFALFLAGIGSLILILSLENAFLKKSMEENLSHNMGVHFLLRSIAFGAGALVAGFLVDKLSFSKLLLLFAAFILLLLFVASSVRHTPTVEFSLAAYAREFAKPAALPIVAIMFLFATHWGAENVSLSLLLRHFGGLTAWEIGAVTFVSSLVMAFSNWLAGNWPQLGRKLLVVGLFLSGLGMLAQPLFPSFAFASLARSLHTFGEGLVTVTVIVLMGRVFARDRVGGANGAVNLIIRTADFLAAGLSGLLMATSLALPFYFSGAAILLAFLLSLVVFRPTLKESFRH